MISPTEVIVRLAVATLLGSLLGLERERLDRPAGLRTHALVALGAALCMLVSAFGFGDILRAAHVTLDPSRVAAQVVSGIGFLGAGTIILRREIVRGLTTAASVWAVAAIGLACGGGLYLAAGTATVLALVILALFKPIEHRFFLGRGHYVVTLLVDRQEGILSAIEAAILRAGSHTEQLSVRPDRKDGSSRVQIVLGKTEKTSLPDLVDALRQVSGVRRIHGGYVSNGSAPSESPSENGTERPAAGAGTGGSR